MTPEQVFGIYMGLGVLMATAACIIQLRTGGCPTRGDAITEFCLWMVLGPPGVGLVAITSPIWVPCMLYCEVWEGSRWERAIAAWMAKPLCKKS